jgi:phenylpropionate dioxygenase-like ring-hydroxylating dioxygenase large terminal subunit
MRQETQVRILEDALAQLERRRPGGEAARAPVEIYTSPAQLAAERACLFRRFPLVVGYSSQVAAPGDFITHDASGVPLVVIRDQAGELRAFINACRHRGTKLELAPSGSGKKSFVCPYHAWTYDAAGRLRGVPHQEGFPGLSLDERGLVPLPLAERHGLVFVRPSPGEPLDIDAYLGPLIADFRGFGMGTRVLFSAPETRPMRMNWKLMLDGSLESYHFRQTHAKSIYPLFYDNLAVTDWDAPHARIVFPKRGIEQLRGQDRSSWRLLQHANIVYLLFPNTIVLVQSDHAIVSTIWPVDADSSSSVTGMLIPEPPATPKAEDHWRKNREIFWGAILEDISMGERIQSTLRSGANEHLYLAGFEHLIARFHEALERALRA